MALDLQRRVFAGHRPMVTYRVTYRVPAPEPKPDKFTIIVNHIIANKKGKLLLPTSCDEASNCVFALELLGGQTKLGAATTAAGGVLGSGTATVLAGARGTVAVKLTKPALKRLKKKKKLHVTVTGTKTTKGGVAPVTGSLTITAPKK